MSETNAEDVRVDEALEYPFRYHEKLPTLREMASCRFCQDIWHADIRTNGNPLLLRTFHNTDIKRRRPRVDALVEGLNLPKPIAEIVKQGAKKTYDQLHGWIESMNIIAMWLYQIQTLAVDIGWCVWSPYGDVDYRKTATKALNSGTLTEICKFMISSRFCIEDEVRKNSSESVLESVMRFRFEQDYILSLEFYWLCYVKNELHRIPVRVDSTLEKSMAKSCYQNGEKYGLEYFWRRLGNDDQISLANAILNCELLLIWDDKWTFVERLFCTISSSNIASLAVLSTKYLKNSLIHSRWLHHQLPIWHRFKDQIAGRDFATIIQGTFGKLFSSEHRMRMLIDIWDTAHDCQRRHVAAQCANAIIGLFTGYADGISTVCGQRRRTNPPCSAAIYMLWRIILQMPQIGRLEFVKQHVDGLVCTTELLESLRAMLHLCLPNTDEQSQFKNILPGSTKLQYTFTLFLGLGRPADLNAILEWMFSDSGPNAVNDYKKVILTLMTWKYTFSNYTFFSSVAKWKEFSQFVDETYAGDVQSAGEMKRMFVEEATKGTRISSMFCQRFDTLRQIIEEVLPVQELTYYKRIRLHGLGEQFRNGAFWDSDRSGDEICLQNFVEWCCDHDEELISKFKKAIPFGVILSRMVADVVYPRLRKQVNLEALLRRFDGYLKWFVGSDEKVRECKLQAVEHCTVGAEMLKGQLTLMELPFPVPLSSHLKVVLGEGLRQRSSGSMGIPLQQRPILLRWLCGGDQAAVRRLEKEISEVRTYT